MRLLGLQLLLCKFKPAATKSTRNGSLWHPTSNSSFWFVVIVSFLPTVWLLNNAASSVKCAYRNAATLRNFISLTLFYQLHFRVSKSVNVNCFLFLFYQASRDFHSALLCLPRTAASFLIAIRPLISQKNETGIRCTCNRLEAVHGNRSVRKVLVPLWIMASFSHMARERRPHDILCSVINFLWWRYFLLALISKFYLDSVLGSRVFSSEAVFIQAHLKRWV